MRNITTAAMFQHSLQTTDRWLRDIMSELEWTDPHKAYMALRATLHALRERMPVDECAQLSAQLPLFVRGLYWEGWNPTCAKTPGGSFLEDIHAVFMHDREIDPELVARAVFSALTSEISPGEVEDVRSIVPAEIRRLLPASAGEQPTVSAARNQHGAALAPGAVSAAHWGA